MTGPMVTVRDATPDDAWDIARIHVASWQVTYAGIFPDEYLAAMAVAPRAERWATAIAKEDGDVLVAEDPTGTVVGFANAVADPDEPGLLGIRTLYLEPEAKGNGYGGALLAAITERIAARGFTETYLDVDAKNAHAIGFYEHAGWVSDGVARPFTIGPLVSTVYRFTRSLQPPAHSFDR